MRVITGIAKGRRLRSLKGMETRPTLDRIKESLFNIIGSLLPGTNFLDLFAGTGAIGIEAISRGANKAVFVEKNHRAVRVIKENLELTGLADRAEIYCSDVDRALETIAEGKQKFDIIFLDPPYKKDRAAAALKKLNEIKVSTQGGLVIVESGRTDVLPREEGIFRLIRQEKYGDTVLSFYRES
ncbi:MAG: 16S rRNA (guanine(966)-N(2))-methyltransferase RsmD [Firmicutes bacterium HGW-Firmicutes-14]|nr:MAG: 16S rRNA (guanine(966)-N(2))-methyltransferase RsmD [Firmicutes bacterium HGW-Firmicutes-14]